MPDKAKLTILIADDENEQRRALVSEVDWSTLGYEVVGSAANGAEALELVQKLRPDVLLSDIRMPFVDGIELAKQVYETYPRTSIVFLSGYDDFKYAQQALRYRVMAYLLKPVSVKTLSAEMLRVRKEIEQRDQTLRSALGAELAKRPDLKLAALLSDTEGGWADADEQRRISMRDAGQLEAALEAGGFFKDIKEGETRAARMMVTRLYDENDRLVTSAEHLGPLNLITGKYGNALSFYNRGKLISALFADRETLELTGQLIADEVALSFEQVLDLRASIGLSGVRTQWQDLPAALLESAEAGLMSDETGGERAIQAPERSSRDRVLMNALDEVIQVLPQRIKLEDSNRLLRDIEHIFELFDQLIAPHRPLMKQMLTDRLLINMMSAIYHATDVTLFADEAEQIPAYSMLSEGVVTRISSDVLQEKMTTICLKAWEAVQQKRKSRTENMAMAAYHIIQEEYQDPDLSLNSISLRLHISPSYLSELIHKHYSDPFSTLLTRRRMQTAYELVMDTDMRMSEIALACGYRDQHYFSYCYKKQFNRSPNIMRREHRNQKNRNQGKMNS